MTEQQLSEDAHAKDNPNSGGAKDIAFTVEGRHLAKAIYPNLHT